MTNIRYIFAALALVMTSVVIAAPAATAQGTSVVVIDQRKIMQESKAGKDIQTKLGSIETQITNELRPKAQSLETEGKALQTKLATMTQQAVMADAALKTRLENFSKSREDFAALQARRGQEYSLTERKAWSDFFAALQPVLQEVVTEKGAQLMLDRSDTVFTGPTIEVTALVITKLDQRTPTISVVRQSVPAQ